MKALIRNLMRADVNNDTATMHDIITCLISMKVITVFRLFHLENMLDYLNNAAECHGDRGLVRWYLSQIIIDLNEGKRNINAMAFQVLDILYITSLDAWKGMFSKYMLGQIFPPKTLATCKIRTNPTWDLFPLKAEVLKFWVECAITDKGPVSLTKKRPGPGLKPYTQIREEDVI